MLILVQNGVGAKLLTPVISILMILGAVSTGVNMIAGIVTRTVNAIERKMSEEKKSAAHMGRNIIFSLIFTAIAFGIAQFGLINVVKKGYAYLGYSGLISVAVPFLLYLFMGKKKEQV